jgi:hypothetical protein
MSNSSNLPRLHCSDRQQASPYVFQTLACVTVLLSLTKYSSRIEEAGSPREKILERVGKLFGECSTTGQRCWDNKEVRRGQGKT